MIDSRLYWGAPATVTAGTNDLSCLFVNQSTGLGRTLPRAFLGPVIFFVRLQQTLCRYTTEGEL